MSAWFASQLAGWVSGELCARLRAKQRDRLLVYSATLFHRSPSYLSLARHLYSARINTVRRPSVIDWTPCAEIYARF